MLEAFTAGQEMYSLKHNPFPPLIHLQNDSLKQYYH